MRKRFWAAAVVAAVSFAPATSWADDNAIAGQIMAGLQARRDARELQNFDLDLNVHDGTVDLVGEVATSEQQTLVLEVARRVPGVAQVRNGIRVSGAAPAAPYGADAVADVRVDGHGRMIQPVSGTSMPGAGVYRQAPRMAQMPAPSAAPSAMAIPAPVGAVPGGYDAAAYAGAMPAGAAPVPMGAYPPGAGGYGPMPGPGAYGPPPGPGAYGPPPGGYPGGPVAAGGGYCPPQYDHPQLPGHAWPSYAAYPNYAAVTYPKQYSPTAWPYIGPFYPYPQVPLGWRKVTLEWDDGWWFLDFKDRH